MDMVSRRFRDLAGQYLQQPSHGAWGDVPAILETRLALGDGGVFKEF